MKKVFSIVCASIMVFSQSALAKNINCVGSKLQVTAQIQGNESVVTILNANKILGQTTEAVVVKSGSEVSVRNPLINVPLQPSEENGFGEYAPLALNPSGLQAIIVVSSDGVGFVSLKERQSNSTLTEYLSCH